MTGRSPPPHRAQSSNLRVPIPSFLRFCVSAFVRFIMYSHPAALLDEDLLKHCDISFGRTSGPGGQHRNKVETAVTVTHRPTAVEAFASELRKQYENSLMAVRRLRLNLP